MNTIEILLIGIGLAMDAFAVSICKGLSLGKIKMKHMAIAGLWFGGFQALMPAIGYFVGSLFADRIEAVDHWIAFVLLAIIGVSMIKEASQEEDEMDACMDPKCMFVLAVATSIDALAVGVTFAFLNVNLILAVSLITIITFVISCIGVKLGNVFGDKYEKKAELTGGIVLILIGLKILLEHLGILVL